MILRRTRADLERGFKVPLFPLTPILSLLFCLYLIAGLPKVTFVLFGAWLSCALAVYFSYSIRHSTLN
jgi:APA family basic amino acid/polyamine antiporter